MKLLFLLPFLLALPALAAAQCFTAYRDLGNKLVIEKKYDEAIAKYEKGKGCRTDKPADGDKQMNALIAEAEKRKNPQPPPKPATKPADAKPKPAPGPTKAQIQAEAAAARADDDAWDIAQGTLTGCRRYLGKYEKKNGRHIAAARQCVRDYSDDDSDSVLNKDDRCPTEKGSAAYDGCPPPKPKVVPGPTDPTKCPNCPDMVFVPGGRFTMGCKNSTRDGECYDDEKPPHEVTVGDFHIGKYEVTQAEWRRVMGSNPSFNAGCDECPVEQVSWDEVQTFIQKLNAQTGKNYRLPTESEWEYAARGGNKTKGYLYSGGNTVADVAWYDQNYQNSNTFGSQKTTRPVGGKDHNELGIHDMSGNVWEWVEDDWHSNFTGAPTGGRAWVDSGGRASDRVRRGGGWGGGARRCRAAYRGGNAPADRDYFIGFRLALQL